MTEGAAGADIEALTTLLGRCLSLKPDNSEAGALRADLEVRWYGFAAYCEELRLVPVVAERLLKRNLTPHGRDVAVATSIAANLTRRRILAERLDELVTAFNEGGIEPILIKGAVSLWTGAPGWRTLRDIDLLVPAPDTERAQAIAERLGYANIAGHRRGPRSRHHMPEMVRADLPGWIEIHQHAGNYNAEPFLAADELARSSAVLVQPGRGRVRIPPPHLLVLHALIHHHVGHSADRHGSMDLKGLYEFAAGIVDLDDGEHRALLRRAAEHPRLEAALDLWLAAAADFYALPVEPPFSLEPPALDRWRTIQARAEGRIPAPRYPGYREEIVLAFRAIERNPGHGPLGRLVARARVIQSLLPKLY